MKVNHPSLLLILAAILATGILPVLIYGFVDLAIGADGIHGHYGWIPQFAFSGFPGWSFQGCRGNPRR